MEQSELTRYKTMLEAKLAQLSNPLSERTDIAVQKIPDLLDSVQVTAERELALDAATRCSKLAREIRSALKRMEEGSYGICLDCGVEVAARRLQALPWAAYCVRCQEAAEQGELKFIELAA